MKNTEHTAASNALLWAAIEKWSVAKWGKVNLTKISTGSGLAVGTVSRIKEAKGTIGLDKVQAIASSFGITAWQLLDPSTDPCNPTSALSPEAMELARSLDAIADPQARRKAYALATQVIEFAQIPSASSPS